MALNFPTSISVDGPWLISAEQLVQLDKLLDIQAERLEKEKESEAQREADERMTKELPPQEGWEKELRDRHYQRAKENLDKYDERTVTFFLAGGRTVTESSFTQAINQHGIGNESPSGFSLRWRVGEVTLTVKIRSWDHKLELDVDPGDSGAGQQLFGVVENWMRDLRVPQWVRLAHNNSFGIVVLLSLWLLGGVVVWSQYRTESAKWSYQQEARELLQHGVNSQNQQKAIELLLAIDSDYKPEQRRVNPSQRAWAIFGVGFVVCLCLLITPNVVIGIWGGKAVISRWHAWFKFAGVTVPTLIFTTIVWRPLIALLFGR
jgi:hypothetical protein